MKLTARGRKVFGSFFGILFLLGQAVNAGQAVPLTLKHSAKMTLMTYHNAKTLTDVQLADLLHAVGFKGTALRNAWAIAKKESHGRPLAHNRNKWTGDNSYGLFQVNMIGDLGTSRRAYYGLKTNEALLDPVTNAKVAYTMSNYGRDWSPWKGTDNPVVKAWKKQYPTK